MFEVWLYSVASVFVVSLISLIGMLTLAIKIEKLKRVLIYFVSFSAGALLADAFIHLLPSVIKKQGFGLDISLYVLFGILVFFVLEKIIHWQHCHVIGCKEHAKSFAYMNIAGDALHNFLDGLIITAGYLVSLPAGIATTLAVVFHEIPQEIGEFGLLLHGGFSKRSALLINFLSALTAVLGAILGLWLSRFFLYTETILVSIAVGGFVYIAGSDLIPELHKETGLKKSAFQILLFILGILVMLALIALE